jgi:hypothetical protein
MNPASQFKSADTVLEKVHLDALVGMIKRKEKELSKCRYGEIGESLWLMEELEHLRKWRDFNFNLNKDLTV